MVQQYSTLFIVATPIGNLKDITLRALEVLAAVDVIACEDTRRTRILLQHYKIEKPLVSYHAYSKLQRTEYLLQALRDGRTVAVVSDAGTPGISDPGVALIAAALQAGARVEAIPGATAFVPALVVSGKPAHQFIFEGFLPVKPGARRRALSVLKSQHRTVVFYESSHRLRACLQDVADIFGENHPIVVARELTKKFEEVRREPATAMVKHFRDTPPRGEFVVVV
ncbi:MAG: 16S rRNA (cytidine(1402)-2'-O)-methyltransferase [Candidatus Omnitrophica bacterium]|nr:16S rRNA (cytidine(1402)-2'-O)-methyltransferase [Candidatus Omnitrophota bacterium]